MVSLSNFLHRVWISTIVSRSLLHREKCPWQTKTGHNRLKDRDRTKIPVKTGRTCLTMPREKAVPETDATSCRRTVGSSRYPFVIRAVDLFKNMGKFVVPKGSPSDTKEWEEGAPRTCYANADQSRIQEKQGQIGAQRGVPRVSLLPSLLPFILSITPSAPANLKQQVPTPLLHGSRSLSGFLLPLPMYGHVARLGRGFRF